jgi:serine/threonine protein kinase
VIIDQKQLYLIFEYLDKDLKAYIDSVETKSVDPAKVKKFLYQLLAGISECHTKRIIHRDLKPANILIDATGNHQVRQTPFLKSQISDSQGPTPFQSDPTPNK